MSILFEVSDVSIVILDPLKIFENARFAKIRTVTRDFSQKKRHITFAL